MKRVLWLLICVLGIGMGVGSLPSVAWALSVVPSIIEAQADQGGVATFLVTVKNDEQKALTVSPSLQKFLPLGTGGQQHFLPVTDQVGLPSWTMVGAGAVVLQPRESVAVPVQIRVPTDASDGGVYEALFFSAQPAVGEVGQVGIHSRIGTLILFTVGQTTSSELTLSEWRLSDVSGQSLRGTVQIGLKNTGHVHVVPQGEIVLRGVFGREVARFPLNPSRGRVLPVSERVFEVSFGSNGLSERVNGLEGELSALGLGTYTITLEGVPGLSSVPTPLHFAVWPWHVLLLLVMIIGGCALVLRWYRHHLVKAMMADRS